MTNWQDYPLMRIGFRVAALSATYSIDVTLDNPTGICPSSAGPTIFSASDRLVGDFVAEPDRLALELSDSDVAFDEQFNGRRGDSHRCAGRDRMTSALLRTADIARATGRAR